MHTIGAVGYLNARPLIHGLDDANSYRLIRRIPSSLLHPLEDGTVDVALCPVIDFQRSSHALTIVPSGAIGSRAQTLTVRVFSRRPLQAIDTIAVDTDSHTSVALVQIVFSSRFHRSPQLIPLPASRDAALGPDIQSALLIGDKVVTREPAEEAFPYQLDLGQAWRDLTGLPFVFATWMCRRGSSLGSLPGHLEDTRRRNLKNIASLTPGWARAHDWPADLALTYLRDLLDFEVGAEHLRSIQLFWSRCASLGLIDSERPLHLYEPQ